MLEFIVDSSAGQFQKVATPKEAHVELVHNAISIADLTFDDDDVALDPLGSDGARVRVLFDGVQRMAGFVDSASGSGPAGSTVVRVVDDFEQFSLLGWPKPAAALTAQSDEYRRYSDDVETVVKLACTELSARLGLGWTVAASTGLGENVRVEFRFHPLADKLVPLLNAEKLRWTLVNGVVDVKLGALFPRTLTLDTGVIGDYTWARKRPTATRVVVGGSGDGVARTFRGYVDNDREDDFGVIREVFKDSRMADGITDLQPDADEVLAQQGPQVSFNANLTETSWFKFGTAYDVGDRVHIQVPQVELTDVISKVTIDDTPDRGLVVVPTIGAVEKSSNAQLIKMIAAMARGVRDAEKR